MPRKTTTMRSMTLVGAHPGLPVLELPKLPGTPCLERFYVGPPPTVQLFPVTTLFGLAG